MNCDVLWHGVETNDFVQEYHTMCRALEERHEKEKQELNQEVIEIKAKVCGKSGGN